MSTDPSPVPPRSAPSALRTVLPLLVRDVAGPYLVYLVLHGPAHWSNLNALIGAAVAAAVLVIVGLVRSRHVDAVAAIVLLTTLAGIVVALWTGNARATLAREAVVSGALGAAFLASLPRRPLMFSMIWSLRPDAGDPAEGWRRAPERNRTAMRVATLVWGVGLLLDAVIRVALAFTLPVSTATGAVTALTFVTVIALVGWMRWYLPRHARLAPAS